MKKIEATVKQIDDWIAALRSGEYKQTRNTIVTFKNQFSYSESTCDSFCCDSFCCLGVAAMVWYDFKNAADIWNNAFRVDFELYDEIDKLMSCSIRDKLIDMNDKSRASFLEIADYIEKELRPLCKDYNAN